MHTKSKECRTICKQILKKARELLNNQVIYLFLFLVEYIYAPHCHRAWVLRSYIWPPQDWACFSLCSFMPCCLFLLQYLVMAVLLSFSHIYLYIICLINYLLQINDQTRASIVGTLRISCLLHLTQSRSAGDEWRHECFNYYTYYANNKY